jgi:hypothetical protein
MAWMVMQWCGGARGREGREEYAEKTAMLGALWLFVPPCGTDAGIERAGTSVRQCGAKGTEGGYCRMCRVLAACDA